MCQSKCECPLCPYYKLKILPQNQIQYIEVLLWLKKHSKLTNLTINSISKLDPIYIEDINNFFRSSDQTNEKINGFFQLLELLGIIKIFLMLNIIYI